MADGICSVPECGRVEQLRRGFCDRHYRAFRRHGDPLGCAPEPDWTCNVPGCAIIGQTRQGMCEMHYRRAARNGGDPGPAEMLRIIGDDTARFWSYVDKNGPLPDRVEWLGPCWLWTGWISPDGYGSVRVDGRNIGAHRLGYELIIGPVPHGLELDHMCRNTACVRPSHLDPVTKSENIRRRNFAKAGRAWLSPR